MYSVSFDLSLLKQNTLKILVIQKQAPVSAINTIPNNMKSKSEFSNIKTFVVFHSYVCKNDASVNMQHFMTNVTIPETFSGVTWSEKSLWRNNSVWAQIGDVAHSECYTDTTSVFLTMLLFSLPLETCNINRSLA